MSISSASPTKADLEFLESECVRALCRPPVNPQPAKPIEIQYLKGRMSEFPNSVTGCYEFREAPHRGRDD